MLMSEFTTFSLLKIVVYQNYNRIFITVEVYLHVAFFDIKLGSFWMFDLLMDWQAKRLGNMTEVT